MNPLDFVERLFSNIGSVFTRIGYLYEKSSDTAKKPWLRRIVVTLGAIKQPDRQLNLGSGKDPSDETIADAGTPLEIRWRGSSYLDLPLRE